MSLLLVAAAVSLPACGKKPAYDNIQLNQNSAPQPTDAAASNTSETQPDAPAQPEANPQPDQTAPVPGQPPAGQPQPAPAQQGERKLPDFVNPNTGQIKDLPDYPNAVRVNVQVGPASSGKMASVVMQANTTIEEVDKFYGKAIKSNGWSVNRESRQPDSIRIELKKGELQEGLIQIMKSPQTSNITISLTRLEKEAPPKVIK